MAEPSQVVRFTDLDPGDNFNPISDLETIELLSMHDAIVWASDRDAEFGAVNVRMNERCATSFARNKAGTALSADEIAAIHLYTQDGPVFRILNARMRESNRHALKPFLPLVKLMLNGLYKLPCTTTAVVYRGVKADLSHQFTRVKS